VPGDVLVFSFLLTAAKRGITTTYGKIFVGDKVVMEANLTAQIVKNK
jgi:3-hydroxymyristoyl/3-hydroxydecanoyl-(acyl carrier protein) dehydratase